MYEKEILEVYRKCNIKTFPIDCDYILSSFGYRVRTYRDILTQSPEAAALSKEFSEDSFADKINNLVLYNHKVNAGRSRFSKMHELGHILFNHVGSSKKNEMEANLFASNVLAPRIAIHYAKCKNAYDVSKAFEISYEAAKIAFEDYIRWRHYIVLRNNKITPIDKAMYDHFYSKDYNKFVWSIKECKHCGKKIINSSDDTCEYCNIEFWGLPEPLDCSCESAPVEPKASNWWEPPGFDEAEQQWLYGDDF